MVDKRRALVWLLRIFGGSAASAVFAVFLPTSWMAEIHRWAGLGDYPQAPIVDYLARSLSWMYAVVGGLVLYLSTDVGRYRPLLRFLGWIAIVGGVVLFGIDVHAGMPVRWIAFEGPPTIACGLAVLWLLRAVPDR